MRSKKFTITIALVSIIASFAFGWYLRDVQKLPEIIVAKEEPESPKDELDSLMDARYPEYRVYGIALEKDHQRQIVDRKYNFRYSIVGGCTADESTRSEAERTNQKTERIMTQRYGKDWLVKFENSVDSLYALDSISIEIARQDTRSEKIEKMLEKDRLKYESHMSNKYHCYETPKDSIRMVILMGEGFFNGEMRYMNQLRAVVDLKTKRVIHFDSTPFGG